MKNVFIIAAVCLLTVGLTFIIIAAGIYLKDSGSKASATNATSDITGAFTEADPDIEVKREPVEESGIVASVKESGNIIIPGFMKAVFKAGLREQDILLYNPKENNCYFIISILLANNTEIYQSELIAPGETLTKIKLTNIPAPGIYEETILRYSCYDMNTLKGMNGANMKFILEVLE